MEVLRPIPQTGPARPAGAQTLAGGWCWFERVEVLARDAPPRIVAAAEIAPEALAALTAAPAPFPGMRTDRPAVMGVLNATPDSFSDGGRFIAPEAALAQGLRMAAEGADILDIGGESTRPGAAPVPIAEEIARTAPLIAGLRAAGVRLPISIDTRKARVAEAALDAGADMVNDVSALGFDPDLAPLVAARGVPLCLMHMQGTPETMQIDPRYDDVVLDVRAMLAARIAAAEAAGIARARILIDPGIGFGKTAAHNLALGARLSALHGMGCAVLYGASRKRFIGRLGGMGAEAPADRRLGGSIAVALAAAAQGAQVVRVHDVWETRQALDLWRASVTGEGA
ncbi:MAG: dihydropteroate synthase [Gemmobacter sp.]